MPATPINFTVGGERNDIEGIADEETSFRHFDKGNVYKHIQR